MLRALMISILFAAIRLVAVNKNLHVQSCSASVYLKEAREIKLLPLSWKPGD
jgi:hypothetical protein